MKEQIIGRAFSEDSSSHTLRRVHQWACTMGGDQQVDGNLCSSPECANAAKLRCPTCIELKLRDSYFCSKECFKNSWPFHKLIHLACTGSPEQYNPWPYYHFSGLLRPAPMGQKREVPDTIMKPDYALRADGISESEQVARSINEIKVLDDDEIESMRTVCKLAREVLDEAARVCEPGITTDHIDAVVHEACIERDCYPSPLGYHQFPKSVCTSVNEVVCHGIPDMRKLENGDICNVDVTIYHRGFHGDLNETFLIGDMVKEETRKLVKVTYECLQHAIDIVRPGVRFREIGSVIQKHANSHGFSVVKTYCGHGIHRLFHTVPNVPHYAKNKATGVMKAGNTFTIEPMINAGGHNNERWPDNWTAVTSDGKPSAQFEQTLLVTESGCDVLTARNTGRPWFMDQLEKNYSPN
ncbi:methionine aminopeptidase, type I [Onchocerca flexuosa]|uniref:Methionine aminopeptidase n=1 Tax=Onchocerca flexuosa TaxID=387005 RepID=A0A238C108_9BILA|nr:methionine aminopeptidase, type I [Onchocerca flexuosa]